MNYLMQGGETEERLALLIKLTSIRSEDIKYALVDHLVKGMPDATAASLNDVPQSNFNRAFNKLNEVAETVERIKELDWDKFKPNK